MKKLCMTVILTLTLGWLMSSGVQAGNSGPGDTPGNGEQQQIQEQICPVCGTCVCDQEKICLKIQLSEEQKLQIRAILQEYAPQIQAAETIEAKNQLRQEMQQKIQACLTEEQLACVEKLQLRQRLMDRVRDYKMFMYQKLELTEEQIEAIQALKLEFRDQMALATSREEIKAIFDAMKAALLEILTDEQLEILEQIRNRKNLCPCDGDMAMFQYMNQLGLSEEQQAQMEQLRQQTQTRLDECETCETKIRILKRTQDRINECLNDQQRDQLRQMLHDGSCQE